MTWHEQEPPASRPVKQVYGYCFNKQGDILLIDDEGVYGLPGGKPEDSESWEETLRREVLEEAQAKVDSITYLGYQLVEGDGDTPYAQVRMFARVEELFPVAVDPATGRQYRRTFHKLREACRLLSWGESGRRQIQAAVRLARRQ